MEASLCEKTSLGVKRGLVGKTKFGEGIAAKNFFMRVLRGMRAPI